MEANTFDPSKYLTKIGSADYLEVKFRLLWLRELHPDADIDTQLISHPESEPAVFKCRITIPGGGSASGWGSEDSGDFRDYLEKAETKAIGRALAALGFGTQFCPDFEEGADRGNIVDSPVRRPSAANGTTSGEQAATPRQLTFMAGVAREVGITENDLKAEVERTYGKPAHELSRRQASAFIEKLQNRRASLDLAT